MVWLFIGGIAAVLTTLGFVPQVVKMWRTRSVGDVSSATFIQFFVGIVLWTAYAAHLGDPLLLISNVIMLGIVVVALVLYFRFVKRTPRRVSHGQKEHIRALSRGGHFEEGYESGLRSNGHDGLFLDGIDVDGVEHGEQ